MQSMNPTDQDTSFRSRTVAAVLAMFAGALGAHHFYLGRRYWWAYPLITMPLLGIALRFDEWYRHWPFFVAALVTVVSLGEALRIALTTHEVRDARQNPVSRMRPTHCLVAVTVATCSLM